MTICRFSADAARNELTPVNNRFITDYLPDAGAEQIKVYLYGLMQCGYPSLADQPLTDALGLTEEEVVAAFSYWQERGLVRITSDAPLTVEYLEQRAPVGTDTLPARHTELVKRVNTLTEPRRFDMRELKHVYDWVEVYGLDDGAVLELIAHCMDLKGRRVSINYISAVARSWADEHILTFEDARAYVAEYGSRKSGAAEILRAWNKRRKPTDDELALYEKWTHEWGFSHEAIMKALPRITVTGGVSFTYLDEQLELLRAGNKTEAEDIAKDDERMKRLRSFTLEVFERAGKSGTPSATQCEQLDAFVTECGMDRELIFYAAECSRDASEPFGKLKRVLNAWHNAGVTDISSAKAFRDREAANTVSRGGKRYAEPYRDQQSHDKETEQLLKDLENGAIL